MEIEFKQAKQHSMASKEKKEGKLKGRNNRNRTKKSNKENKYIGVRQRPSGRWVAEIKDTTQKIRMWLGTFQTAEEAAKAYDEAACLLRGSNTRTNFLTRVSLDSPLASRIQNLLNNRKGNYTNNKHEEIVEASSTTTPRVTSASTSTNSSNSHTCEFKNSSPISNQTIATKNTQIFDDAYRPDLSSFVEGYDYELESGCSNNPFSHVVDVPYLPHTIGLEISEFERIKVERQISASLYAISGVQEYMDTVQDNEALWDLPPLCSFFY